MPTPIQEKAYHNIFVTLSTINKKYFELDYQVYYNYNPDESTYEDVDNIQISMPVENITLTLIQNTNESGIEQNCSLIIKNNDTTVVSFTSNDWAIGFSSKFTFLNLQNIYDYFYSASFA